MQECGLQRQDIYITTKLAPRDHGYEKCIAGRLDCSVFGIIEFGVAVETSLNQLGVDYIDCYLIHWPGYLSSKQVKVQIICG